VAELVRKYCKKLRLGNAIGTTKNTLDYNKMTNQDRPFLQVQVSIWKILDSGEMGAEY
jgi:hypothetical protein